MDSPSPRRPASFRSASLNLKASKGQCGIDKGNNDRTHSEDPYCAGRRERSKFADRDIGDEQ